MARATILLAEDDERVRTLLAAMLDDFGYDVLTAVDGEDALRVAAAHAGDIDVVLTDLVMPNMVGPEFARRLVELRPSTQVVYMSSYADAARVEENALEGVTMLEKPFQRDVLARTLEEALGRSTGDG